MRAFKLIKIGQLFKNQLKTDLTPTSKIIYSVLQSLARSKFVREHNNIISYSLDSLSKDLNNIYSVRMLKRQIKILAQAGHLNILDNTLNQYILTPVNDNSFIPIVLLININDSYSTNINLQSINNYNEITANKITYKNIEDKLNKSDDIDNTAENRSTIAPAFNLILSLLLNKAAFNYRGTGIAQIYPYQIKTLADELGICKRTLKNALRYFIDNKIINAPLNVDFDNLSAIILKTGFIFTTKFFNLYRKIVKVERSATCTQIFRRRSYLISKNRITRNDRTYSSVDTENHPQNISHSYIDKHPNARAADPLMHSRAAIPISLQRNRSNSDYSQDSFLDLKGNKFAYSTVTNSGGNFWYQDFPKWKNLVINRR